MLSATTILSPDLQRIFDKVVAGGRIDEEEAARLFACDDLNALALIANILRERKNGNVATYIRNVYVNYSNVCILACEFCAFGARRREAHAFEFSIEEIVQKVRAALASGVTEVHMVGGLHPSLPPDWYLALLAELRRLDPNLFIKAFTAIEIRHLAERVFKCSLRQLLETLRAAGLGALTGGGAEIFAPAVRAQICRGKESGEEWLEVHRVWHELGMRSTATMLFGHVESYADRIEHLHKLRDLQDATGGFTAFIPFAFEPQGARPALQHIARTSAHEELKNLAVSRIYLDNFDHLTAYWISMGLPLASVALNYGVDDLHGTIEEEKIFHMAGATTPQAQSVAALEKAIREAGRVPMPRDTAYRRMEKVSLSAGDTSRSLAKAACA
ncbi:MAG TPA: aminofutalosine synthase MqnE [Chthoniobacteraceae bacterium]|nr:aminofutalosine synthase MqnE [Chthoniobacteraceae bacterium]